MKDREKHIKEMPICVNCIHAYVCEEYNLNRDMLRKRCAYYNDHFLDIEQHDKKVRQETAEKIILSEIATIKNIRDACVLPAPKYKEGYIDGCNGILFYLKNNISKQFGVEIKEN